MSNRPRPLWLTVVQVLAVTASLLSLAVIYMPDVPLFGRWFYPLHYREVIEKEAQANGLDPLFVASVIRQESGFRPKVKSKVGAVGLMQLMPKTASWASQQVGMKNFKLEQLEDPAVNIKLGCWYLKYLFAQFHDPAHVLAAYNGGEGNLTYWKSLKGEQLRHAYPETQSYVEQGLKTYSRYKSIYQGELRRVVRPSTLRVIR